LTYTLFLTILVIEMKEEFRKKILNRLRNPITDPYKQATNFFIHPWAAGCSDEEIIASIESDAQNNANYLLLHIQIIEILLAEPDKYDLIYLVAWGANQALDDPQNETIPWLQDTVDMMKAMLRKHGHDV